jgi:hypothetical protein
MQVGYQNEGARLTTDIWMEQEQATTRDNKRTALANKKNVKEKGITCTVKTSINRFAHNFYSPFPGGTTGGRRLTSMCDFSTPLQD